MGSHWLEDYLVELHTDGLWYIWNDFSGEQVAGPYHSKREADADVIDVATWRLEDRA